ncbi:MAG TPA: sulfite exporter TauE/SafE family protein, partial [Chthoniobacteraceae bacterium]|nr:sulfite exporter TauE/SafE family protein [Chthoniobacteraceae bacterium]
KHHSMGNVDMKLAAIMVLPTILGGESGAQVIQFLKRKSDVDAVVGVAYIIVLTAISAFMFWESWRTLQEKRGKRVRKFKAGGADASAFSHISKYVRKIQLAPMVDLPASGVKSVSIWAIILISAVGGFFSGFLGGGAGYIRMPSMVYLLGIPTHVAVGTDLFEVVVSAGYLTVSHAWKGNVDIMIALVMHTGAALGAQIGATGTEFFHGVRIRMAFVPLPLIGAGIVLYGLLTGRHHQ